MLLRQNVTSRDVGTIQTLETIPAWAMPWWPSGIITPHRDGYIRLQHVRRRSTPATETARTLVGAGGGGALKTVDSAQKVRRRLATNRMFTRMPSPQGTCDDSPTSSKSTSLGKHPRRIGLITMAPGGFTDESVFNLSLRRRHYTLYVCVCWGRGGGCWML